MATQLKIKQSSVASKQPASGDLVQGELALNTADQKLYSKDSSGNIFEIGAGGGAGNLNAANTQVQEFTGTATATFTVTGGYGGSDTITVYNNGVRLHSSDFNASNGTTVVLGSALGTDDVLTIIKVGIQSVYGGSEIQTYEYTVTASTQTDFNATYDADKSDVEVYVNGIKLLADDFVSTTGTKIVLDIAAVSGDDVVVRVIRAMTLTANNQTDWNETDVTLHGYLKNKPNVQYTSAIAVGDGGLTEKNFTTALNTKLGSIAPGSEVNVQTDWTQTDTTKDDYLNNKPFITIGTGLSVTSGVLNASAHLLLNNTLTSTSTTLALTAAQGKILNDGKVDKVTGKELSANDFTDTLKTKLASITSGAEVNVKSNWSATSGDAEILNKPNVQYTSAIAVGDGGLTEKNFTTALNTKLTGIAPGAEVNVQSDWTEASTGADSFIKNKPATFAPSAHTHTHASLTGIVANQHIDWTADQGATNIHAGNYTDTNTTYTAGTGITLTGTVFSTAAEVNVQSDWTQATTGADDYIKNKPATFAPSAHTHAHSSLTGIVAKEHLDWTTDQGSNDIHTLNIPIASASAIGGIKVGANLTITNGVLAGVNSYTLPTASATVLGGIKVGNNLTISNGVLSGVNSYTLPIATSTILGGFKVGANLTINSSTGVLAGAAPYTHPTAAGDKHVPSGGATNQVLKYGGSSGVAVWGTDAGGVVHFNQGTTPSSANLGDTWYDTSDGTIYKYINDGSQDTWVDISTAGGGGDPFPTQTNKAGQYLKTNGTDVAWNDLLSSPAFTGTPTAPTAGSTTNTTQLATTAFVGTAITNLIDGAPGTLDTLDELAAALNDDANHIAAMTTLINARLALAGGALTGALTSNSNITITGSGKYYGDGSALSGISTDNFYATSVGFSQTTGVLTIGRNGSLADLTVDLDGRYDQHYNQATAPSGTTLGDGWYDTDDGTFYKRVNDGTTDVWVDISTAGAGGAAPDWTEILNNPVPTFVAADANKYLGVNAAGNALEYQQDNITPQGMYEHSNIISADYTIGNNMNAISAGPITINAGVDITIPVTSNWVVV
jgi:hypothetical protein